MKAILFDLDGTIGDTLPLCIEAFRKAIKPLANKSLSDAKIIAQFGPSEEGTIQALIPNHFAEGIEKYIEFYEKLHFKWPEPFEGIVEILRHLKEKGIYLGLVTGKGLRSTRITLKVYNLSGFFGCIKTGSIHGPVKRERIEEVISETNLDRSEILYVGDAPSDITASKECGIKVVAAAWAPTSDFDNLQSMHPDYIFGSIQEFREFVENQI
jgi:phosphoglycolate phosphatase/pyrophosphatase PpaX